MLPIGSGIGANGMPAAWRHAIVGQSILADTQLAFHDERRS
jgi:hypothetical protein